MSVPQAAREEFMAVLKSEDAECETSLRIEAGSKRDVAGQKWQRISMFLNSGDWSLELANTGSDEERDGCMFCREPSDEVAELVAQLQALADKGREKVNFEPSEPSFELEVSRRGAEGLMVHVWLDAGNAKTGIYRWDAAGIRFFTLQAHLVSFIEQLQQEFAC